MTKRKNSAYITIWKKTHNLLKKISKKKNEPMTVVLQRAVEHFEKVS